MKNLKKKLGHNIPTYIKEYYRNYYLNRIKELEEIYYIIFEINKIKNNMLDKKKDLNDENIR